MLKIKAVVFIALTLTACTSPLPTPIVDLDDTCRNGDSKDCQFSEYGLTSFDAIKQRFATYATLWEREADKKKQQASAAGEVTFIGLLTSAIGLATKSPETVIIGGTAGASGAIYNKRYALDVQSHNYDLASQTAQCMFLASSAYKDYKDNEDFKLLALESLFSLKRKLRSLQTNLVLAAPDFTTLQAAMSGKVTGASNSAGMQEMKLADGGTLIVTVNKPLEEYSGKIKACASQIGG